MKKVLIVILFVLALVSSSDAQFLSSSLSSTQDTITVAGSTSAGSRWFTGANEYAQLFVMVHNGTFWNTYKLDFPCKMLGDVRAYINGADTTLRVQTNIGGIYAVVPFDIEEYSTSGSYAQWIDYGNALKITSPALIKFFGVKIGNLYSE